LTFGALDDTAGLRARVLVGSQVVVLGLVAVLCACFVRARRLVLGVSALTLLAFGAGLMLPPLAVDAYPTTYRRPAVTYQASSIAEGAALFRIHCAPCHGSTGPATVRGARPCRVCPPICARPTPRSTRPATSSGG